MLTETTIEIDAPPELVWDVYADVEAWPAWNGSVTDLHAVDHALDGAALAVGRRYSITQPRFPRLTWEVTTVVAGRAWQWRQRSPGGATVAHHRIDPLGADRARVTLGVDQRGPIGVVVGLLARRLTRRYLAMEATGLKATAEARHRSGAAAS